MIITCNVKPKYNLLLSHDGNITEWVWFHVYSFLKHIPQYYFSSVVPCGSRALKKFRLVSRRRGKLYGGRVFQYFFHF